MNLLDFLNISIQLHRIYRHARQIEASDYNNQRSAPTAPLFSDLEMRFDCQCNFVPSIVNTTDNSKDWNKYCNLEVYSDKAVQSVCCFCK